MILVTGGNGNIGHVICEKLIEEGYEVLAIGRSECKFKNINFIHCDVTNKEAIESVFKDNDIQCVIHLASMLNTASRKDPSMAVKINICGTLNLLDLCKEKGIKFIYGSSFNAIGEYESSINNPIDEKKLTKPDEFYGETKNFVEKLGIYLSDIYNFQFAAARIPTVVGVGQASKNSPWREQIYTYLKLKGATIDIKFNQDEYVPLSNVDETAKAILELVKKESLKHKIYNLPNESLKVIQLKKIINTINPNIAVDTGLGQVTGIPSFIDWSRFKEEFNYKYKTIEESLKEYAKLNCN